MMRQPNSDSKKQKPRKPFNPTFLCQHCQATLTFPWQPIASNWVRITSDYMGSHYICINHHLIMNYTMLIFITTYCDDTDARLELNRNSTNAEHNYLLIISVSITLTNFLESLVKMISNKEHCNCHCRHDEE